MTETHEDPNPMITEQNPEPSNQHSGKSSLEEIFAYLYGDHDNIPVNAVPINPYYNPCKINTISDIRRRFIETKSGLNRKINSDFGIRRIVDIKHRTFRHYRTQLTYHEFTVESNDGSIETFNENDLVRLNPYDLIQLHGYCYNFADRFKEARTALPEVRFAMQEHINLRIQVDFQLGIEFEVEKLATSPPNESLEGYGHYRTGTVVGDPPVFVCRQNRTKKTFRASESHKYSTESLEYLRDIIQSLPTEKCPEELRKSFITQINLLINFRELIRRFDRILRGDYTA